VPALAQGFEYKTFYKMEVNWGFSSKKVSGSLHTFSACSDCALTRRAAGGHGGPGRRQIPHVRLRPPGVLQPGHDPVHRYTHSGSRAATPLYATNRIFWRDCCPDADELFFCPQAADSIAHQRTYQQRTMETFHSRGVEEMRFVRIPYSGL
jgi:hypothetical protein